MANTIFSLLPTQNFDRQLRSGVFRSGSRQLINRILVRANLISTKIGNFLANEFNQTDVALSIRGLGSTDLQAHFGLTEGLANQLVDGMANIIRNSVQIQTSIINLKAIINIRAVEKDWLKYTQLPGAEYISKQSGVVIPVVRWLLIDPSIDIGQAAYNIVFLGDNNGRFNTSIVRNSRSGRAIMVELSKLGGSAGYVLPEIVRGSFGVNFIAHTLGQPNISERVLNIVKQNL